MTTQTIPEPVQAALIELARERALLPWVEANQGLISLIALAVALVFALAEYRRANQASADRREEWRQCAIDLCDELEVALDHDFWPVAQRFPAALDAMLKAPPPSAKLIIEAVGLSNHALRWTDATPMTRLAFKKEEARAELTGWREKLRRA